MSVLARAVAYWRMCDYSGSGDLLDGSGNGHDAQFGSTSGSDTNDPLPLLYTGTQYAYFPGSADNEVSVAGLSNSTAYDYTVTYLDDSSAEGEETTDGSGNLVLGNTQTNFDDKKVRSIVVVPDGGGATQASIDFTDKTAVAKPFASVTGGEGKTWTLGKSAAGVKFAIIDRDVALHGTDDYFLVADHADLNFADGVDFTLIFVARQYGTPAAGETLLDKDAAGAAYGIYDNGTPLYYVNVDDGPNQYFNAAPFRTYTPGELFQLAYACEHEVSIKEFWDGVNTSTNESVTPLGAVSNAADLYIGANGGAGGFADMEFIGAAIFREALSEADIAIAGDELQGIEPPRQLGRGIAWRRA